MTLQSLTLTFSGSVQEVQPGSRHSVLLSGRLVVATEAALRLTAGPGRELAGGGACWHFAFDKAVLQCENGGQLDNTGRGQLSWVRKSGGATHILPGLVYKDDPYSTWEGQEGQPGGFSLLLRVPRRLSPC